ncbi:hypothetical protein FGADI_10769 [Fusarium gaditjirri]|uniref:NACHT domain-containing protein n=1 Tax=Fusarium gaditjirri TaxID=282569 RepID=A0A8H4WQD0_9HYPO|nr:hypothetical protein FGADI_10769 [Fusarium gaditjirri]
MKVGGSLWHNAMDYSKSHEAAKDIRTEGTGLGLLTDKKFQKWFNSDRTSNVLAGIGRPGSGKTVLASLVVDEVKRVQQYTASSNIGLAYFYFSYKVSSPMRGVALALLEQLYLQSPSPPSEIKKLESRSSEGQQVPFRELVSTISTISNQFQKCYIVIDALDECASEYQQELLYLLGSIRDTRSRLFVTSRPSQIDSFLELYPCIQITTSKNDIELFVRSQLENSIIRNDAKLVGRVTDALTESSEKHGMFLLVMLQVRELLHKTTAQEIARWLHNFRNHAVAELNLDAAYQKELDKISKLTSTDKMLAEWTLTWLYFAQRPLEARELVDSLITHSELMADLGFGQKQLIENCIRVCMGLVRLVQAEGSITITFSHFSIKEFFDCTIGKAGSHLLPESNVAIACLSYINGIMNDRFYDHYGKLTPDVVETIISDHPFLEYAAKYWGRHVSNLKLDESGPNGYIASEWLTIFMDRKKMEFLSHILFSDRDPGILQGQLVKSSALHVVAYFGLNWAVDRAWAGEMQHPTGFEDSWGRTAVHIAAKQGNAEFLEKLLVATNLIVQGQRTDDKGRTPWHYVAMSGNAKSIKVLASKYHLNMEKDNRDKFGFTPLQYAAEQDKAEAFRCLIEAYPVGESSNPYKDEALNVALANGRIAVVQVILDSITPRYDHLVVAIRHNFAPAIKLLLDYIDDLDEPEVGQPTALMEAVLTRNNAILSFLIRSGASLERVDGMGRTPLAHAVDMNNAEGVRLLLDAGANPSVSWSKDTGLIEHAASQDMTQIITLLLGFRPSSQDLKRAVFCAAKEGHINSVRLLVQSGCVSAGEQLSNGQTLSEAAEEAGFEEVAVFLRSLDASAAYRPLYTIENPMLHDTPSPEHRKEMRKSEGGDDDPQTASGKARGVFVKHDESAMLPGYTKIEQEDIEEHLTRHEAETNLVKVDRGKTDASAIELKGKERSSETLKTPSSEHDVPGTRASGETIHVRDNIHPQLDQRFLHGRTRDGGTSPRAEASPPAGQRPSEPILRSIEQPKSPKSFFLLKDPIPSNRLCLGMIVADARDPLRSFAPKEPRELETVTKASEYETVNYDWTMSKSASKVSNAAVAFMLNPGAEFREAVEFHASRLHRRQVQNHDHVITQICSLYEDEILKMMRTYKQVFVVVGLLIATDLQFGNKSEVTATVDAGVSLGVSASLGGALDGTQQMSRHLGDQVLAVQYRVLKTDRKKFWARSKGTSLILGTYFKGDDRETML